jgi:ankyrin repeat protein
MSSPPSIRLRLLAVLAALMGFGTAAGIATAADRAAPDAVLAAAKNGTAEALGVALAAHADPNAADADGTSALHWAVHRGDLDAARLLLDAGAAVDRANRYGVRPSYLAAENGDAAMLRLLLDAGADPNAVFAEGESVLMTAARAGDEAAIGVLIDAGAAVDAVESRDGQTALMWAAAANNGPAVAALLAAGARRDAREATGNFTALGVAVRAGAVAAARALLAGGAEANETLGDGMSRLVLAAHNANYDAASALLEYGADPNAAVQGWTALHEIALVRRWNRGFNLPGPEQDDALSGMELVRQLAAAGANVDARQTEQIEGGGGLNRPGTTPLIDFLVEHGASLEGVVNSRGWTALRIADGIGLDGLAFVRYPEAAEHLRSLMRERGLPVPPVEWDGPAEGAVH